MRDLLQIFESRGFTDGIHAEGELMRTTELRDELNAHGVPAATYSLLTDANEAYCLVRQDSTWRVYYSERGNRNNERVHESEDAACRDLLARLMSDGSVM